MGRGLSQSALPTRRPSNPQDRFSTDPSAFVPSPVVILPKPSARPIASSMPTRRGASRGCRGRRISSSTASRRFGGARRSRWSRAAKWRRITTCRRASGISPRTARATCRSPCCWKSRCNPAAGSRPTSAPRSRAATTSPTATSAAPARSSHRCSRASARSPHASRTRGFPARRG